jgi:hypothetical protein
MTLAVGLDATLLCRVWCDPQAAAASGCHDRATIDSPSVTGDTGCDRVLSVGAFLREEAKRSAAAPDAAHAIVVPRSLIAQLATVARPEWATGREWSLAKRPLSTVLRL